MRVLITRFLRVGLQTAHPCRTLFILSALALAATAHAVGLNDTGITNCSDTTGDEADSGSHPRQDCRYGRDAADAAGFLPKIGGGGNGFDFSKIANDGTVLGAAAVLGSGTRDWACTRDNVTGLIWEVKTTSGLRSQSHSYNWYSSNAATNGGYAGWASGGTCATSGRCDTEKFVADVNAAGLCGATDWRMPSRKELGSIVDYGINIYYSSNPTIDPSYFPNTQVSNFWSASAYAGDSNNAWYVSFRNGEASNGFWRYNGYSYSNGKGYAAQVRLVRAGQ